VIGLEEIADARRYLAALDKMGRNGEIFIRRALGEKLRDLGSDYGVSSERIRSIECATRRKLLAQEPEEEQEWQPAPARSDMTTTRGRKSAQVS